MSFFCIALVWSVFCFGNLETERLRLRAWRDGDVDAIYAMVQDEEVGRYLKHVHFDEHSVLQKVAERANKNIEEKGFGYFVCELKSTGEVIGLVGLNYIQLEIPHFPCYTVSWILGKKYWKSGYATEAAQKLLTFGFEDCQITSIFACTAMDHTASRKVMERLGMKWVDDFRFPGLETTHPLSQQVLYKATKNP